MRNLVYGFSGESNSGKTTLIIRLVNLIKGRVVVVKHDPKAKARIDVLGKDSDLFFRAGADVLLLSPTQSMLRLHGEQDLAVLLASIGDCEYVFVEGLKHLPIPKLAVMRNRIVPSYLDYVDAIVVDKGMDCCGVSVDVLDINDLDSIRLHIDSHAIHKDVLMNSLKEKACSKSAY